MSLCRKSDGCDVYVLESGEWQYQCCQCELTDGYSVYVYNPLAMVAHLNHHIESGDRVPVAVIQELRDLARQDPHSEGVLRR